MKPKPCPYCNSKNTTVRTLHYGWYSPPEYQAECRDCGARGPRRETKTEAIKDCKEGDH